jgi:uncharacterized protein YeaO (DUF488 family)
LSALLLSVPASAEIADLNSAINKAGRQRMLSQRMAKCFFQIGLGVDKDRSRRVLDSSVALFERQLGELKSFAPSPEIRETYQKLDKAWQGYRQALIATVPQQADGVRILQMSDELLRLAHQGTQQLESRSGTRASRLVNIAGRQRMLSQRMAKFYQAAAWGVGGEQAGAEIDKARSEFVTALEELSTAPSNNAPLREELELVKQQWMFFENALSQRSGADQRQATTVATTSERILETMENVVALYEKLAR